MKGKVCLILLSTMIGIAASCSMPMGWKPLGIGERARRADMVVYGKVYRSPERWRIVEQKVPGKPLRLSYKHFDLMNTYQALIKIYCIIKGDNIPRFVNVTGFGWRPGHCVNSQAIESDKQVLFLTRGDFAELTVHEVNVQVASEPATTKNLIEVLRSTQEPGKIPHPPRDASTKDALGCPKLTMNST